MEKSVDNIESMFRKAEADLNLMQTKLEYQFGNLNGAEQQQNPLKLMKKLKEVKEEHAMLAKDAAAIQEAQKEFADYFKSQILKLTDVLKLLEERTGACPEEDPGMATLCQEVSSLLGIPEGQLRPFPDPSPAHNAVDDGAQGAGDEASSSLASSSASANSQDKHSTASSKNSPTTADQRMNGTEFVEVSEEEFLSVSELVRLRVKREDVNRVYQFLWQHFKEEQNQGKLTVKEMNAMGIRVTGTSGQAKLKVLRALKICTISKNGDVSLI